ncbi:MAG: hypothetical protein RSA29_17130 [Clostridium sp.]|uniref:hypothetical protein n=1 Tax=Clostridium sp. TaxID=1506 RepID=UPI00305AA8FE
MNREDFIQDEYDSADEELRGVYAKQKANEKTILNEIASIMLSYNIVDSKMKLTNKEKQNIYYKLSRITLDMFANETKDTKSVIEKVLKSATENNHEYFGIKSHKDEVLKIINEHYKGKHFSDRVWANENDVSKMIHKEVKDFLDGKVNVNQIKSHIEKQFNANKYNVERLVESEIGNIQSKITEKYFKDYGIKRVKYNACLCNTCAKCMDQHEKPFDVDDPNRPSVPRHPKCKCFYVQVDGYKEKSKVDDEIAVSKGKENNFTINLKLLGFDEKKELQKLIDSGVIDKAEYNKCYDYFDEQFKNGVVTPIETVYNKNDRFIHVARRHKNMISKDQINNIINSLENPDRIYKSVDKFGIQAKGYVKKIDNNELLTIVRNGIITSYYPDNNYIKKKIKKGEFELIWGRK